MRYERIIFIQGDEAWKYVERLDNLETEEVVKELSEYHYPGEHETDDRPSAGLLDDTETVGDYIVTWNSELGPYVGLEFKLNTEA